jgi:hypothetical protein
LISAVLTAVLEINPEALAIADAFDQGVKIKGRVTLSMVFLSSS